MTPESPELTQRELGSMRWRLSRIDPLYPVAEALRARDYAGLCDPETLLDGLHPASVWSRRIVAAEALRMVDLNPEQANRAEKALTSVIARQDMKAISRFGQQLLNAVMRFAVMSACTGITMFIVADAEFLTRANTSLVQELVRYGSVSIAAVLGTAVILTPLASPWIDSTRDTRLREVALKTLQRWGGIASIEALAMAASMQQGVGMGAKALPALRCVLKRSDPSDYGALQPEGIRRLCDLLTDCDSRGLTYLAEDVPLILEVLGRVGGGNAVATVEQIADSGRLPVWRAKARDILPILRERQRREQDSARLLRATESPQTSESLLRPAAATAQPVEILPRAAPDDSTT